MHVPDGFLSPQITVPALAAAAPLWVWAARRHFGPGAAESLPVIGAVTALAFVIQTIMIPVPGGTPTHLVGVMVLALLYHPLVAFLCESLVLLVQALFLAGWGSMQAATLAVAGVRALQHRLDPHYFPVPAAVTFAAMMVPSLTVAGVVEGLYTVFALSLVRKARL